MKTVNDAVNAAAWAVRRELKRLDYVEGDNEPDLEDKAIAIAVITAYLDALRVDLRRPEEITDWAP